MGKPTLFAPGFGEAPPHLAGREACQTELNDALGLLLDAGPKRHYVIYGPRGMGKTALLDWLADECRERRIKTIRVVPSEGLRQVSDLPELLLPDSWADRWWVPAEFEFGGNAGIEAGVKAGLGFKLGFKDKEGRERRGILSDLVVSAYKKQPHILLIDEAHMVECPKTYELLFNVVQTVAKRAKLMLVLAGTPGLMPKIKAAHATFITRSWHLGVGTLSHESCIEALRNPMAENGVAIDDAQMDRMAEASQGYPFFIQHWGAALWDVIKDQRRPIQVTQEHVDQAEPAFVRQRETHYMDRYIAMSDDDQMLDAAYAVGQGFLGKAGAAGLGPRAIKSIIEASLADTLPDAKERRAKATQLRAALHDEDYFWYPPGELARPGIPSFMKHIAKMRGLDLP